MSKTKTNGTAGAAPGTPSTPGQGGAWRDTTRDGTPVRNVMPDGDCWAGEWFDTIDGLWRRTMWNPTGSFLGDDDACGLDLIPTPAPSPAAEADAGFTPGPWGVDADDKLNPDRAYGITQTWTDEDESGTVVIAEVCHGPTAEADARLIAAAPDLYHALQGLYELVSARAIGIPDEQYSRVTAAAAALALATRTEGGAQ